jgi:Fe-S-cluster containining protein
MTRTGSCNRCGLCCKLIGFPIDVDAVPGYEEWLNARGWRLEGVMAVRDEDCPHLTPDGCDIHGPDKPLVCRTFPVEADQLLPGCGFSFEDVV